MVIAGAATILGRGLMEKATGLHIYWGMWFFAFLPCVLITILFHLASGADGFIRPRRRRTRTCLFTCRMSSERWARGARRKSGP